MIDVLKLAVEVVINQHGDQDKCEDDEHRNDRRRRRAEFASLTIEDRSALLAANEIQ